MFLWRCYVRYYPDDGGVWYVRVPQAKQSSSVDATVGMLPNDIVASDLNSALAALKHFLLEDIADEE